MIITISGTPGAGKSTIAKLIAKKGWERIYVGGIRRKIAKEKRMTLKELNEYALTHPETDVEVDKIAVKRALDLEKQSKKVIVEGRPQFHFIPQSLKVYLKVEFEEGVKRIWKDLQNEQLKKERNEDIINSLEELKESIKERTENDRQRYLKYYDLDYLDENNYDLVIDTSKKTPEEVVDEILNSI